VVAEDDLLLLEPRETLGDSRGGESDPSPEFGEAEPSVSL
jgi:hypothetical protein